MELRRRFDAHDRRAGRHRDLGVGRHDRHPRAAGERRLGHGDAHPAGRAIADEPDGVDRLTGPAGADDHVTSLEVRVARALDHGRPEARIRRPDGASGDGLDHGVDDGRQLREPPDARLARRERPGRRLDDGVPEVVAQPRRRWPASPDATTCPRPWPGRRSPARSRRGPWRSRRHRRARRPSRPASAPWPARRRATSALSASTMCADAPVRQQLEQRRSSTGCRDERGERERPDEARRGGRRA